MTKIVLGGHWNKEILKQGWKIFDEKDQDIKQKLNFEDNSIECIFTEHVVENLEFLEAVEFFKESLRILTSNGIFRIIVPCLDKFISNDYNDENMKKYVSFVTNMFYKDEDKKLNELNLEGIEKFARAFMLNSIFYNTPRHSFIWETELMTETLKSVGFSKVFICKPGESINTEYAIERRCRHLYTGYNPEEDKNMGFVFDAESLIVEALK
jgi:ubiquinone/menaquinone biosynthesis C-methylase UbiE